jgi:hypothetical protein
LSCPCLCLTLCSLSLTYISLSKKKVFEHATKRIRIEGTEVVAVPLFAILDPNDSRDYLQRVEPSVRGGRKMAMHFADVIAGIRDGAAEGAPANDGSAAEAVLEDSIPLSARS